MPRRKGHNASRITRLETCANILKSVERPGPSSPKPFPFLSLPVELRFQIWKEYCPQLHGHPRILDFTTTLEDVQTYSEGRLLVRHQCARVYHGGHLAEKTKNLRHVLAVHEESRSLALQVFPDPLFANASKGRRKYFVLRFRKDRDVVLLDAVFKGIRRGLNKPWQNPECRLQDFFRQIENLAVFKSLVDSLPASRMEIPIAACSQLKNFFIAGEADFGGAYAGFGSLQLRPESFKNRFTMFLTKDRWSKGRWLACWPDGQNDEQRMQQSAWSIRRTSSLAQLLSLMEDRHVLVWPLVLALVGSENSTPALASANRRPRRRRRILR